MCECTVATQFCCPLCNDNKGILLYECMYLIHIFIIDISGQTACKNKCGKITVQ